MKSNLFGGLFVAVLIIAVAFYLFQYGQLSEFSFKAFTTEARLIKQKVQEAQQDVDELEKLKTEAETTAEEVQRIATDIRATEETIEAVKTRLFGLEGDLGQVKRGLVEIEYLMYAGRNQFPNPYHDRILQKLNELLIIAIPDNNQRAEFIQELQQFTGQNQ